MSFTIAITAELSGVLTSHLAMWATPLELLPRLWPVSVDGFTYCGAGCADNNKSEYRCDG